MRIGRTLLVNLLLAMSACTPGNENPAPSFTGAVGEVKLMTLNPGHFHAGLVHKYSYDQVDPTIYIYAPEGEELDSHLALIEQYNTREEEPTHWIPVVYRGSDYLEKMLAEKPGNVLVLSGNNARKIEYIHRAIEEGINILADKPMIIHPKSFDLLKASLKIADEKGLLVNDIMTERHEITSILQRELSQIPEIFGELVKGTPDEPAISKESVHFFSKNVSGRPLIRPAWFFDARQQGEAIVDVSTHLTDLILWQCFPGEAIDYENSEDGVEVLSARSWATELTSDQFKKVTNEEAYPDYLLDFVDDDSTLHVDANGEFTFKVRGVHGKVSVKWGFENPAGGDTHFSKMRGTKTNLVIRQDSLQGYVATLYVEPVNDDAQEGLEEQIALALASFSDRYPGLTASPSEFGWEISIPDELREGHEEHFTRVTEDYLQSLIDGRLPAWEHANLLTKYFITTKAYELSREE